MIVIENINKGRAFLNSLFAVRINIVMSIIMGKAHSLPKIRGIAIAVIVYNSFVRGWTFVSHEPLSVYKLIFFILLPLKIKGLF